MGHFRYRTQRKHYAITSAGRAALVERQEQWTVVADALAQVWRSTQQPDRIIEEWA